MYENLLDRVNKNNMFLFFEMNEYERVIVVYLFMNNSVFYVYQKMIEEYKKMLFGSDVNLKILFFFFNELNVGEKVVFVYEQVNNVGVEVYQMQVRKFCGLYLIR